MVREFVETILERLVLHIVHEWAPMVRRSRGELEHGGGVVWEGGGWLVLVLVVVVVVSLKAHFLYLLFFLKSKMGTPQ